MNITKRHNHDQYGGNSFFEGNAQSSRPTELQPSLVFASQTARMSK